MSLRGWRFYILRSTTILATCLFLSGATYQSLAAATPGGVSVAVVQSGQWQGGFGANLIITNNGTAAVNQWTLNFTFTQPVTALWNGVMTNSGNNYTIANESWNGSIPVGQNVSVGFNGSGTLTSTTASNCVFNGSPCTLSFSMGTVKPPVPPQAIVIGSADGTAPVRSLAISQGANSFPLTMANPATANFSVVASNSTVVTAQIVSNNLRLTGLAAGRSALKIKDSVSGLIRYVGVRVKNADGSLPKMPSYVSISFDRIGERRYHGLSRVLAIVRSWPEE